MENPIRFSTHQSNPRRGGKAMDFVGYRNTKLVEQLTRQGRITKTFKGKRTFDSDQFALLYMMASATYDWPLDDKTQGLGKMPRIYAYGWLEMARALGMTLPDGIDEIEVIGNEPRAPKLENAAYQRISKAAKKLEANGLIKCLRKGSPQKRNNAVWLLTIGTPEENREVEAYARQHMYL